MAVGYRAISGASAVSDSLVNAALRYMAARFGFLPVPAEMAQKVSRQDERADPDFRPAARPVIVSWRARSLTAADLYLFPDLRLYFPDIAELKAIADKAPNINRWAREMAARPSVRGRPSRPSSRRLPA